MIIAIDGPAGAGKSTIARMLARRLNFLYVDTGAMYRAFTLKALRAPVDFGDIPALTALANRTAIELIAVPDGVRVLLDGEDVSAAIRTPELTNAVFNVAQCAQIREVMVAWQREYAAHTDIVMEGRDIGTVVFPQAELKFYLDASVEIRAQRRVRQLREQNRTVDLAEIEQDIRRRDHTDFSRTVGPLRRADDAVYVDTSHYSIEQVLEVLIAHVNSENQ